MLDVSDFRLRPYQQDAVNAVFEAYSRGVRRQLISMATGLGKTIVFSEVIRRRGGTALVIAHRDELVRQAVDKIRLVIPDGQIGVVKALEDEYSAPIVVASVQSLHEQRLKRWEPGRFRTLVVDEAHHSAAPSYRRVIEYLQSDLLLGVTATPYRGDKVTLRGIFDEIVFSYGMREGIIEGYLADIEAYRIVTSIDLDDVRTYSGDFVEGDLARVVDVPERNKALVEAYLKYAYGAKAIVFAAGVEHAEHLAETFRDVGITAETIFGHTPVEERRAILDRFSRGETKVLCNVAVLTEGFDDPTIEAVILARPTKSLVLYTQMVGRGTRKAPGKEKFVLIDVVDATRRHKVVTVDELIGLPVGHVSGRRMSEVIEEYREETKKRYASVFRSFQLDDEIDITYHFERAVVDLVDLRKPEIDWRIVYDEIENLRSDGDALARALNEYAVKWGPRGEESPTDQQRYTLEKVFGWPKRYINTLKRFEASYAINLHMEQLAEYRTRLAQAWSTVLGIHEDFLVNMYFALPWQLRPASDKQRDLLRRFGVEPPETMTAGEASILIQKLLRRGPWESEES